MAVITDLLEGKHLVQGVSTLALAFVVVLLLRFYDELAAGWPYKKIPLVGRGRWEFTNTKAKQLFVSSAKDLLKQGFSQGRTVFQVMTSSHQTIVLHHKYINEVKSHPDLDFNEANKKAFLDRRYQDLTSLMASTSTITIPLSKETALILKDKLPVSDEWKPFKFAQEIPHMVARLSSLVFLGDKICRDSAWLNVAVNYTIDAFVAVRDLRLYPSILRPVVHWFLPSTRRLRQHFAVASSIIQKEIEKRELIREGKLPAETPRTHSDTLDWCQEIAAGRPFNIPLAQIGLSLAAIHTTSNLLTNVMYDLTAYPEYVQALREEIKTVVEEDGILKKTSLTKLKLMDSVMKESQRMNPAGIGLLHRLATRDVVLSDGIQIPKGANIIVPPLVLEDESVYPGANVYDGYRFYNKRQEPGNEHRFRFVTTSPEHYAFGHGLHACPGRFFAANEIKILLVHLVMKYDWKFAEARGRPKSIMHGTEVICDPTVTLLYKARQLEVDLSALGEVSK